MTQQEFQDQISSMPSLYHTLPGAKFDVDKSEVITWLLALPEIKSWLWERARSTGRMNFDPATGKWQGVVKRGRGRPRKVAGDMEVSL